MKTIVYNGSSKIIKRIVHLLNRKAPLPLDGDGDAVWGTSGQVLTTDGNGNTSWTTPQGSGGDVTDVEVNGNSVVNAQGVAEVNVPTKTSDLNNDSGFIDGTDLSTALSDYTPTSGLATVATSGSYNDLSNKPTIPTAASDITYDPTTSGLSATKVQGAIDAVEGQIANSSDAYSASKAYAVGDYCIYNDTLYRCVTACSAASWSVNSGCFVADTLVGAINEASFYKAGDVINFGTINNIVLSGRSTGTSGNVIAFLPLPKICHASSASVSASICRYFGSSGMGQATSWSVAAYIANGGLALVISSNIPTSADRVYNVELIDLTVTFS